jgi:tRNA wybutosine-synthesizing protein 4
MGAGFDTLYFWLRENPKYWREDLVYFEVDFPEVLSKKLSAILKKQALWPLLDAASQEDIVSRDLGSSGTRELRTPHCRFVSTDMRIAPELKDSMERAGFRSDVPTLFLSECVLVYMQAMHGDSIIEWASSAVSSAPSAIVVYEQVNPTDAFGKVMVENLMQRGCPLLSIHEYPTLEAQRQRYLQRGFECCFAADMNEVYSKYLDQQDLDRIHRLEMMDEFEEWHLIQAHYLLLVATRAGAAADRESLTGGEAGGSSWIHDIPPVPAEPSQRSGVLNGGYARSPVVT